ncbi:MAG: hypothetical protein V7K92_16975 [Nostoc sp.]|uniref:hypothetical protein n=1 Tax=Nostoc sp. TaxID=1180 RepID=UPI002FF0F2E6
MSVVKGLSNDCPTISVDAPQLRDPKDDLILAISRPDTKTQRKTLRFRAFA